jgi:hypothetical protein
MGKVDKPENLTSIRSALDLLTEIEGVNATAWKGTQDTYDICAVAS